MRTLFAAALLFAPTAALADPVAEARHFFERGNERLGPAMQMSPGGRRDRAIRSALEEYQQSVRIVRSKNALFNVGICYEELREWDSAWSYYTEYLGLDVSAAERTEAERRRSGLVSKVALVEVVTTPAGATVYVDRRDLAARGRAPASIAVAPGERRILIDLAGHDPVERSVTATIGQTARVEVSLVARPMIVEVTSEPQGAEVRVGRADAPVSGTTPARLQLPAGSVRLFLSAPGFDPIEEVARGAPGESVTVRVALGAIPSPGMLRVAANVAGARVEVDGEAWGEASAAPRGVRPGRHQVLVTRPGYRPARSVVEVREGASTDVTAHLESENQGSRLAPWPTITLIGATLVGAAGLTVGAVALARTDDLEAIQADFRDATGSRRDDLEAKARKTAGEIDDLNRTADALYLVTGVLGLTWLGLTIFDGAVEGEDSTLTIAATPGGIVLAGVTP